MITEWPVDGHMDKSGITYLGIATRQPDGTWHCLANVGGALCRVEVTLTPDPNNIEYVASLEARGLV